MPIHDWSRADAGLFHDFHQTWTINIRNALYGGLLPNGFSALVEQHAAGMAPDVIALQRWSPPSQPAERMGGAVITATPPKTRHIICRRRRSLPNAATALRSATCSAWWSVSSKSSRQATRAAARPCGRLSEKIVDSLRFRPTTYRVVLATRLLAGFFRSIVPGGRCP